MLRPFLLAACASLLVAAAGCRPLSQHPLVVEAVAEVRGNGRVGDALGTPVTCSTSVRGTANETDGIASLQFDASGSKGKGVVVVEGKKTRNEWGVTMLELRPAGGERILLTADLEARTGTDTPKFDPAAQPASSAKPAAPPRGCRDRAAPRSARAVTSRQSCQLAEPSSIAAVLLMLCSIPPNV